VNVLGFGIMASDFVGASMMIGEEMDDYKRYREKNPGLNNAELAELMLKNEQYDTIFVDFAEDPEYLIERFEFLELILANSAESQFGTVMSMDEIRATVIGWRRSEPGTFNSPWIGFIRQTMLPMIFARASSMLAMCQWQSSILSRLQFRELLKSL
jgi:hypothetical protein